MSIWRQLGLDIDGKTNGDNSGFSVSLSTDGLTVAIGSPYNDGKDGKTWDIGLVRVYTLSGSLWIQVGQDIYGEKLLDNSGFSVSLSGDGKTVAIGAPGNDGKNGIFSVDSGHVRVYTLSGSSWVQVGGDIDGEKLLDNSSYSVSLSFDGKTVAIGSRYNDGKNGIDSGHVRVYKLLGNLWVQLGGDIDGEKALDNSGFSVSLSGDGKTVAIGAPGNDGNNGIFSLDSGHVRVYTLSGTNSWIQVGGDINGNRILDKSGFSVSLSLDGKTVAVGAPYNDGDDCKTWDSGLVKVYILSGTSWIQLGQEIYGTEVWSKSGFSVMLSSDGKTVAIGAPYNDDKDDKDDSLKKTGEVRVYTLSDSDKLWKPLGQEIDGESECDSSGYSVSLSGDGKTVAFGSRFNDGNGNNSGQVRVYKLVSTTKTLQELVDSKTPASGILSPGYRNKDLLNGGFTAAVMKGKGYTATDLKQLDYSVRQMKQARFPLSSLLRAGFLLIRLTAYYRAEKFLALGIDAQQLRVRGILDERLREMGFDI